MFVARAPLLASRPRPHAVRALVVSGRHTFRSQPHTSPGAPRVTRFRSLHRSLASLMAHYRSSTPCRTRTPEHPKVLEMMSVDSATTYCCPAVASNCGLLELAYRRKRLQPLTAFAQPDCLHTQETGCAAAAGLLACLPRLSCGRAAQRTGAQRDTRIIISKRSEVTEPSYRFTASPFCAHFPFSTGGDFLTLNFKIFLQNNFSFAEQFLFLLGTTRCDPL